MDKDIVVREPTEVMEHDKVGRPCKYSTHVEPYLDKIEEWIREGLTDYCIADNLGIHQTTLIKYKADYSNLSNVYTRAQVKQVQHIVNATFKRAEGYNYEEQTLESFAIKDDEGHVIGHEMKPTKTVTKHVPGDVNAQKFYLINRDPEHWKPENNVGNVFIQQNNYNIPELKQSIQELLTEYKTLDAIDITPDE